MRRSQLLLPGMVEAPVAVTCRMGCGACCIAPSISSPIPGMPLGKPAGQRCVQLDAQLGCKLFGDPRRPPVCSSLRPRADMCGDSRTQALRFLDRLENLTAPRHDSARPDRGSRSYDC